MLCKDQYENSETTAQLFYVYFNNTNTSYAKLVGFNPGFGGATAQHILVSRQLNAHLIYLIRLINRF